MRHIPPDMAVVRRFRTHSAAAPAFAKLAAAGIDVRLIDSGETRESKSVFFASWFIPGPGAGLREETGPWDLVVPTDRVSEAVRLLEAPPPRLAT